MDAFELVADTVLTRLVWTSAQAVLLIGIVWLIGRLLPELSSALRCALWWLVGLQLILGLCWAAPVPLPLLTSHVTTLTMADPLPSIDMPSIDGPTGRQPASLPVVASRATVAEAPTGAPAWRSCWRQLLLSLWLAAVLVQTIIATRQWRASRRVIRASSPLGDGTLQRQCLAQARQLGLRRLPRLRLSDAIDSPQVTGLWRPTILLPSRQQLTAPEVAMALGHELAHLRRGDLWLGWVPVVAQRLFFFHPLVRWAMREYALNRESACDEQVMRRGDADPQAYARLLVRLGVCRPLHAGLAGASPTFQNLKRRLIMLQQNENLTRRRSPAWLLIVLIAAAFVLPYRVTARSSQDANPVTVSAAPMPPSPPAPPAAPAPRPAPAAPGVLVPPAPAAPPAPPAPPDTLTPPSPPPPPPAPDFGGRHFNNVSIDTRDHAEQGFILVDGNHMQVVGSAADSAFARSVASSVHAPTLWLRQGNTHYVTHDQATIDRMRQAYAPLTQAAENESKLASREGEMADREGGLAEREGAMATAQGELAGRQAELAGQRAELQAAAAGSNGKPDAERQSRLQRIQTRQNGIHKETAELHERQAAERREIDKRRQDFARQREAIASQRKAASRQREKAAKVAEKQAHAILVDALKHGKFKRRD